ncbi:MAG: allantoinase AllB [Herpetosiphonaceae bacterium]|nr:allantoinase AllB [Herpetosiphonaceae bacterium]
MSVYDLLVRNATVVGPDAVAPADLAVADGRIVALGPELDGGGAVELDAAGLHLLPGVIDAHVHCNDPGRAEWEGFATATKALAAGGVTCFFDMPLNAHPPTTDAASFDHKVAAAQGAALVDWALWGGLVPGNLEQLPELAARGAIGFKAFMSNSGIDDFAAVDDLTLYEGMRSAAALGLPVAVHAESDQITAALARRAQAAGRTGVRDYLSSRPVVAELEAIGRALLLAEETGCALHIVHVSTGRGVGMVAAARARGVDVSCETCPHYLVLTEDDGERIGALAKCAPPLRSQAEQDALWQHLLAGTLPMVASDHSPAPADMKTGLDFFQIWGGISGCQSTLALLIGAGVIERNLPLTTLAQITAGYVAERFGIASRKGRLVVGADADFVLVNLQHEQVLQAEDLFYRHRHSPYVGRSMRGQVVRTVLRGQTVFLDGQPLGPPAGQLITPTPR